MVGRREVGTSFTNFWRKFWQNYLNHLPFTCVNKLWLIWRKEAGNQNIFQHRAVGCSAKLNGREERGGCCSKYQQTFSKYQQSFLRNFSWYYDHWYFDNWYFVTAQGAVLALDHHAIVTATGFLARSLYQTPFFSLLNSSFAPWKVMWRSVCLLYTSCF